MSVQTVPQDVEADDKLIGPFSARQSIYLGVTAVSITLIVGAFQISEILGVLAIFILGPVAIFFAIVALPLRKDQPTETYIAAMLRFWFSRTKRYWLSGEPNTTITIVSPKEAEIETKEALSRDEVSSRLSFLTNLLDTEGSVVLKDEAEAKTIFDKDSTVANNTNYLVNKSNSERQEQLMHMANSAAGVAHDTPVSPAQTPPEPVAEEPVIKQPISRVEIEQEVIPEQQNPLPQSGQQLNTSTQSAESQAFPQSSEQITQQPPTTPKSTPASKPKTPPINNYLPTAADFGIVKQQEKQQPEQEEEQKDGEVVIKLR